MINEMYETLLMKEQAETFSNGFMSLEIAIVLNDLDKDEKSPMKMRKSLEDGIKFMDDSLNGYYFISGKHDENFISTIDGLKAYRNSLDLLKDLKLRSEEDFKNKIFCIKKSLENAVRSIKDENTKTAYTLFSLFGEKMLNKARKLSRYELE